MKRTSIKMNRHFIAPLLLMAVSLTTLSSSCRKKDDLPHNPASKYSSEVVDKWITMQLRLMRNANGIIPNHALSRQFAYAGIAALEALAPGLPAQAKSLRNWNGLNNLPTPKASFQYYYPANVNAALATINRAMFINASAADKQAIDSLESALYAEFLTKQPQAVVVQSSDFGKAVGHAVYQWSESDGYKTASNPYTPPVGAGLWEPTPTAFATALTPYWGSNRTVVKNSIENTQPVAPPVYATDTSSAFYKMVKHVYDVSQSLSNEQKAIAVFWRDVPGVSSPGHWLSILQITINKTHARLDKAALAYALTGAAANDALISCWKTKYNFNLLRPITYIRKVMGHSSWNSHIGTPPHPDYSSGHAVLSAAAAAALKELFGNVGSITDNTYEYMGLGTRTYPSFEAIAEEAALSRIYAGIHFLPAAEAGLVQGKKVAANIFSYKQNGLVSAPANNGTNQTND